MIKMCFGSDWPKSEAAAASMTAAHHTEILPYCLKCESTT